MTHLYLVRHADYVKEQQGKLVDGQLSPKGLQQAERLRDRLLKSDDIKIDCLPVDRGELCADRPIPATRRQTTTRQPGPFGISARLEWL